MYYNRSERRLKLGLYTMYKREHDTEYTQKSNEDLNPTPRALPPALYHHPTGERNINHRDPETREHP